MRVTARLFALTEPTLNDRQGTDNPSHSILIEVYDNYFSDNQPALPQRDNIIATSRSASLSSPPH